MTARIIPFPAAPMAEWVEYDAAEAAALERMAKEAADRAWSEAIMANYHDRREQPAPMADLRDGGLMEPETPPPHLAVVLVLVAFGLAWAGALALKWAVAALMQWGAW